MDFANVAGYDVEIVFSFDTTGSMFRCVKEVSNRVDEVVARLLKDVSIRIGVMVHGDYGDDALGNSCLSKLGLSSDGNRICNFIKNATKTSGEDAAECYEYALHTAATSYGDFNWSKNPLTRKALVVIGDDVPHPPSWTNLRLNWREEAQKLHALGVKIYAVQAFSNRHAKPFYAELANLTDGIYLNLKDFSVVPDMLLAICYREANMEMLEMYKTELDAAGKLPDRGNLRAIFSTLLLKSQNNMQAHYAPSYINLIPLVIHTAWWNPKANDNATDGKFAFLFDNEGNKFVKQEEIKKEKEKEMNELVAAYANSHLESRQQSIVLGGESPLLFDHNGSDDRMDSDDDGVDISSDVHEQQRNNAPIIINDDSYSPERNGEDSHKKIKLERDSLHDKMKRSNSTNNKSSKNNATTSKSINNNNNRTPGSSPRSSRLANRAINNSYPSGSQTEPPKKGQPRRASSFAFGEVSPSTPFHSLFVSPSELAQKQGTFPNTNSPIPSPSPSTTASPSVLQLREDEGSHSDSETSRKRKATWEPPTLRPRPQRRIVVKKEGGTQSMESPRIGQTVAVRAEGGGFWLARVLGVYDKTEVDVQWMDEIKSHHNYFVLLDWYDTISLRAIFKVPVKLDNMKKIGILKLPEEEKEMLESLLNN